MEKGIVALANGKTEFIFNDNDILMIIENELGYDFSRYVCELMNQADKTKVWAEQKYYSDMNSYEATMESQRNCLMDILDMVEKLQGMFKAPRLKKEECFKLLKQISREISNEI